MLVKITKASDSEYCEERDIKSLNDLCELSQEFKDLRDVYGAPLILWFYDDKPFGFDVQIYDDYIE